jgi:pSer/pThr/pTyr-binding forkhead associated (FHA) protein
LSVLLAGPAHTTIEDLNSTNGVFVNNVRITEPTTLRHGDNLEIANTGEVTFRFELRPLSEPPDVVAAGRQSATE